MHVATKMRKERTANASKRRKAFARRFSAVGVSVFFRGFQPGKAQKTKPRAKRGFDVKR